MTLCLGACSWDHEAAISADEVFTEQAQSTDQSRPNIVLIQVDDFGYDDLAFHGNEVIETPSLDQLAKESVRFEQFYVSSLCAPTRAALLTGRHFLRTGVSGVHGGRDYINLGETLFPELLQQAGYRTGMWGKWHSGKTHGYLPWDRGFDEAYYATLYNYFDNNGLLNGEEVNNKGSATNTITDYAIDFVRRNQEQSFFAYVSYMAPHNPWRAPQEYIDKYEGMGLSYPMASLYGMIDNLDENIGRLLAEISALGLDENTLIVFISDNGPWVRSYRFGLNEEEWAMRNPSGLRGMKADNWENGIRSPLFIRWTGKYEPQALNRSVTVEDIFPTILNWAAIPVPEALSLDGQKLVMDEVENRAQRPIMSAWASPLVPQVEQQEGDSTGFYRPLTADYHQHIRFENQRLALRDGDYKFVMNESAMGADELFDMRQDPSEARNLLAEMPERASAMRERLAEWYNELLAEPHAMQMPEFQIGYKGRKFSQVYALSPVDYADELSNRAHYIANWRKAGDWAEYRVHVHTPGQYQVYLMHQMLEPQTRTFAISVNNSSIEARLSEDLPLREPGTLIRNESAYWHDFDLYTTYKESIKNQLLGTLNLTEGQSILRLEQTAVDEGASIDQLDQIIAIQLVKTD